MKTAVSLLVGFFLFFASLTIAGLQQAVGWALAYPLSQWSLTLVPMWMVRSIGGTMMFASSCLFAYNIFMTMREKSITPEDQLDIAVPVEKKGAN